MNVAVFVGFWYLWFFEFVGNVAWRFDLAGFGLTAFVGDGLGGSVLFVFAGVRLKVVGVGVGVTFIGMRNAWDFGTYDRFFAYVAIVAYSCEDPAAFFGYGYLFGFAIFGGDVAGCVGVGSFYQHSFVGVGFWFGTIV